MTETADDLFRRAYQASVIDEDKPKAIDICRHVLRLDPAHFMARMLLGVLLGDSDEPSTRNEAKSHFHIALGQVNSLKDFHALIVEEDPLKHLGIWYWQYGDRLAAALLLIMDYYVGAPDSRDHSLRLAREALDDRPDLLGIIERVTQWSDT